MRAVLRGFGVSICCWCVCVCVCVCVCEMMIVVRGKKDRKGGEGGLI